MIAGANLRAAPALLLASHQHSYAWTCINSAQRTSENCVFPGAKLRAVLALLLAADAPGADTEQPIWTEPAVRWPAAALLDRCWLTHIICSHKPSSVHLLRTVLGHGSRVPAGPTRHYHRLKSPILGPTERSADHTEPSVALQVLQCRHWRRSQPQHRSELGGALCGRQLRRLPAGSRTGAAAAA